MLTAPDTCLTAFDESPTEPFRTAVFIDYEDESWRKLVSELDVALPEEERRDEDDEQSRADLL